MKPYNKKDISKDVVKSLCEKYKLDALEASILARRGIVNGEDILYFLENDTRFLHEPFLFNAMEDAVERINQAIDEKEKIFIFGDRDTDGVASTALLYGYLKKCGADVHYRLPIGEDAYGLSIEAVDDFAKEAGDTSALIITVDCGISNYAEIEHASSLFIDTIITDHHNPPEKIPNATVIINPKMSDSGYPFSEISGAAVVFKLVSALRYSKNKEYNQDFCLLQAKNENGKYTVEALKFRNLVKQKSLSLVFENPTSIYNTKLPDFLSGQQIFVWDEKATKAVLTEIFGKNVDFQMFDVLPEIEKIIPQVREKSLCQIRSLSKISRYSDEPLSDIESFFNIFVTFAHKKNMTAHKNLENDVENDLQLVAIAALADVMPMKNENRIFVKSALKTMNEGKIRTGIAELFAKNSLVGAKITSGDISWKITPILNAAGRMGKANLALELLISENPREREKLSEEIMALNNLRKQLVTEGEILTAKMAEKSVADFSKKLCVVIDEKINRGITGLLAAKISKKYNTPTIVVSFSEDKKTAIGSLRSCRGLLSTKFLDAFGKDFFINYGGHDKVAGFSFVAEKKDDFLKKTKEIIENISLASDDEIIEVDAELPENYLDENIIKLVDKFEPYGEKNRELNFFSKNLKIVDAISLGKTERQHLKLTLDCGKCKFPAIFWGEGSRLNTEIKKGDNVNILYNIERNNFNGSNTTQMVLQDVESISDK